MYTNPKYPPYSDPPLTSAHPQSASVALQDVCASAETKPIDLQTV